jgi:hypothetical protein
MNGATTKRSRTIYGLLGIDSSYSLAYANRGYIYADLRLCDEALVDFPHSTQRDPTFAQAYLNIGVVLLIRGVWRETLKNRPS